jgi:hypothetical protein
MIFCPNIGNYCNKYKLMGKDLKCDCIFSNEHNHNFKEIKTYKNGEAININYQCNICGRVKGG